MGTLDTQHPGPHTPWAQSNQCFCTSAFPTITYSLMMQKGPQSPFHIKKIERERERAREGKEKRKEERKIEKGGRQASQFHSCISCQHGPEHVSNYVRAIRAKPVCFWRCSCTPGTLVVLRRGITCCRHVLEGRGVLPSRGHPQSSVIEGNAGGFNRTRLQKRPHALPISLCNNLNVSVFLQGSSFPTPLPILFFI